MTKKQTSIRRLAVSIHILRSADKCYYWELRTPDGTLATDSLHDGEFAAFADQLVAFKDAARAAYHHMTEIQV